VSDRTALVTGAAGFVGEYVVEELIGRSVRVLGLVRQEAHVRKLRSVGVEPILGDIMDPDSLTDALAGVDVVIHLAAVNRDRGPATMAAINYRGTINLLGAARASGVKRLVQVVAIGADSRRSSPLSRSQGLAAEAVVTSETGGTVLEAGVIFGPGDAFGTMLTGLARLAPVVVVPGDGRARFEPISVQDVARAAVNALDMPEAVGKRYEIVGPEVLTLDQVYDQLLLAAGIKRARLHLPPALLRPVVRLMERLVPEPPVTEALLDLLALNVLSRENSVGFLLGRPPQRFSDQLEYVQAVTARVFAAIVLGRRDRRGVPYPSSE